MKGLIFVKKLISGLLALSIAASTTAVSASAKTWTVPKDWAVAPKVTVDYASTMKVSDLDAGTTDVTIKWTPVKGANGYRIYKWDVKDGKYKTVKTVSGGNKKSLKVTGLTAGTSYRFAVKAYSYTDVKTQYGANYVSTVWSKKAETIVSTKPAATKITKVNTNAHDARVYWNKVAFKNQVDDKSNYKFGGYKLKLYYKNVDDWKDIAYLSGGRTNVKVVGLKSNTKYSFKIVPFTVSYIFNTSVKDSYDTKVFEGDGAEFTAKTKSYWK
jgi:hypothetical protein